MGNASRGRMKIFAALFCVVVVSVCATSDEVNIALLDDAEQLAPEVGNPTSLIDEMDDAETGTDIAKASGRIASAGLKRKAEAGAAKAKSAAASAKNAAVSAAKATGDAAKAKFVKFKNKLVKLKDWGTKMKRELAGAAAGLKQCKGLTKGATLSSIAFDALQRKCPKMIAKGVKSVNDIKNFCKRKEACMASFNAMKNTMHLCATLASGAAKKTGQALSWAGTAVSVWLDEHPRTVQFLKFGVGIGLVTAAILFPPAGVGLAIGGTVWNLGWIIQSAVSDKRKCVSQYGKDNCAMSACQGGWFVVRHLIVNGVGFMTGIPVESGLSGDNVATVIGIGAEATTAIGSSVAIADGVDGFNTDAKDTFCGPGKNPKMCEALDKAAAVGSAGLSKIKEFSVFKCNHQNLYEPVDIATGNFVKDWKKPFASLAGKIKVTKDDNYIQAQAYVSQKCNRL